MKPIINGTAFGSITIAGQLYEHDVIIRLNGKVEKRRKKLSKKKTERRIRFRLKKPNTSSNQVLNC